MATIHAGHGSMARFVPKEIAVGILFAAGTTLARVVTPLRILLGCVRTVRAIRDSVLLELPGH